MVIFALQKISRNLKLIFSKRVSTYFRVCDTFEQFYELYLFFYLSIRFQKSNFKLIFINGIAVDSFDALSKFLSLIKASKTNSDLKLITSWCSKWSVTVTWHDPRPLIGDRNECFHQIGIVPALWPRTPWTIFMLHIICDILYQHEKCHFNLNKNYLD